MQHITGSDDHGGDDDDGDEEGGDLGATKCNKTEQL